MECPICLDSCGTLSAIRCGHKFHNKCINRWDGPCPICREPWKVLILNQIPLDIWHMLMNEVYPSIEVISEMPSHMTIKYDDQLVTFPVSKHHWSMIMYRWFESI